MGRAKKAIEALGQLAPRTARVLRGGLESDVPVEVLVVGDVAVIEPDERVAADGFVIAGSSSVNQAPITGESVPSDRSPKANPKSPTFEPPKASMKLNCYGSSLPLKPTASIRLHERLCVMERRSWVKVVMEVEAKSHLPPI